MKKAVSLAQMGEGFTSPNPCVGAVIVRGGKIIGEGWHKEAGKEHAEILAMNGALSGDGQDLTTNPDFFVGAEMYVTLEPCAHEGKTGACAGAVAEARFKKVFIGMKDPFEKVNGKGAEFLENNGVEIEFLSEDSPIYREIRLLNQPFLKSVKTKLPYVVLKAGMSMDGKIALSSGKSKWITSPESRADAKIERSKCDAVLVGYKTVLLDNPSLSPAEKHENKNFYRIVLDPLLELDLNMRLFEHENVFVACTDCAPLENVKKYKDSGIEFFSFGENSVSLKDLLAYLADVKKIQSVFVEGGSETHGKFLDEDLVDKVLFYIAPMLLGGKENLSVIGGKGVSSLANAINLHELKSSKIGNDIKLEGLASLY